jgi:hypothetical protein
MATANQAVGEGAGSTYPMTLDGQFNKAYDPNIGPALNALQQFEGGYVGPSGLSNVIAQSIPDVIANTTLTATAGSVFATIMQFSAGQVINNISIVNNSQTTSTPTHQWAGLATVATTAKVVAVSSDQTTTVVAADTVQTFALTSAYTIPTSGQYYVFFCIAGTTGPTVAAATSLGSHGRGNVAPFNSGPGSTSATTVPAVGSTLTQPTASAAIPLIYIN